MRGERAASGGLSVLEVRRSSNARHICAKVHWMRRVRSAGLKLSSARQAAARLRCGLERAHAAEPLFVRLPSSEPYGAGRAGSPRWLPCTHCRRRRRRRVRKRGQLGVQLCGPHRRHLVSVCFEAADAFNAAVRQLTHLPPATGTHRAVEPLFAVGYAVPRRGLLEPSAEAAEV